MAKTQNNTGGAITTKVVGGIGNQLFCYFAGYYLSKKLGFSLRVDVSDIRNKRSVHDVSIEALELPGIFYESSTSRVFCYLSRIKNKIRTSSPIRINSSQNYISPIVGFDPHLDTIKSTTSIQGYFQTYKYFRLFLKDRSEIKLKAPSKWYLQMVESSKHSNFTALHVRRGDYRVHAGTYGLLSKKYYEDAIAYLRDRNHLHKLYIFSDDIPAAKELLHLSVPSDTVWVDPPKESNPVESLLLMSLAKSNIIANSTYSWWGAALNFEKSVVIAPEKWFRSMPDPEHLYPPEWHTINSSWES
jgi:hypothetical protein